MVQWVLAGFCWHSGMLYAPSLSLSRIKKWHLPSAVPLAASESGSFRILKVGLRLACGLPYCHSCPSTSHQPSAIALALLRDTYQTHDRHIH
jgi:hypothetical protein